MIKLKYTYFLLGRFCPAAREKRPAARDLQKAHTGRTLAHFYNSITSLQLSA